MKTLSLFVLSTLFVSATYVQATEKPKLTLDKFLKSVSFTALELSPDGTALVIGTERRDWEQQIFRHDLWLWRDGGNGSLIPLTQSGHDTSPKWSPDGRWIAFLSDRKTPHHEKSDSDAEDDDVDQLYVISPNGGEAVAVTRGDEEVHTFSWSSDSKTLYFATRNPWNKAHQDEYKQEWKDVVQYRESERGDTIYSLQLRAAMMHDPSAPASAGSKGEESSHTTPGSHAIASSPLRVDELRTSPDGRRLAILTTAISKRWENVEDYDIYVVDLLPSPTNEATAPRRVTHNQAVERYLRWSGDSRHIFFSVDVGSVTGPYHDLQPHLYWVDVDRGTAEQWNKDFAGAVERYAVTRDGALTSSRLGTEAAMYSSAGPSQPLKVIGHWQGSYNQISTAPHAGRVAFVYSALTKPPEVYLAENPGALDQARTITSFNAELAECDLPQGKPYRWKADDGSSVEGMLVYPPGKFAAQRLPMFTFIHGGPAEADGNLFEADWYKWGALAATQGWLVFEPNYRGSTGYGDKFLMGIVPAIVSRPGKDILEGIDALVRDGIADPDRLSVGGYSYGGYMTNWLITQTTRFKAAVTGAGAVEHVANWGNDDTTFDDAYFLGGRPWEAAPQYHDEAAIFQIQKVRTPTHIVAGSEDIRVAVLEDYLLERALFSMGVPHKLLIFPGEGHELDKNPWHEKIKLREELKWLERYGGVPLRH